jgi:hypothetical protein
VTGVRGWQKLKGGLVVGGLVLGIHGLAFAGDRLLWTGGVTAVEGAAGGGLVPWALINGLGTGDQTDATAFVTGLRTARFELRTAGAAVGWRDRVELSYAHQTFDGRGALSPVQLGQDVLGVKLRLCGDAVYDQDRWLPQVALGATYHATQDFGSIPKALGATRASGYDLYVAATKVLLGAVGGHNALVDVTVTNSDVNQFGLLGAGGTVGRTWRASGTVGVWLADRVLVGGEYRAKRGALAAPVEGDAHDLFIAVAPSKHLSVVVAYADLGPVAGQGLERGPYLSLVGTF